MIKHNNSEINQNFALQMAEIKKLEQIEESLATIALNTQNILDLAHNEWVADNAQRFFKKAYAVSEDVAKDSRRLGEIAEELKRITVEYMKAEEAAREIAENRGGDL